MRIFISALLIQGIWSQLSSSCATTTVRIVLTVTRIKTITIVPKAKACTSESEKLKLTTAVSSAIASEETRMATVPSDVQTTLTEYSVLQEQYESGQMTKTSQYLSYFSEATQNWSVVMTAYEGGSMTNAAQSSPSGYPGF